MTTLEGVNGKLHVLAALHTGQQPPNRRLGEPVGGENIVCAPLEIERNFLAVRPVA